MKYILTDERMKEALDEVYAIGVKNGGILMKNKILKKINRDWSLVNLRGMDLIMKVLKIIDKVK